MSETVLVERSGAVARLILNRPQRYNAFDLPMIARFADALTGLATDGRVRAVVITGAGEAFCAGGDLKWAAAHPAGPPAAFHALAGRLHQAVAEIRRMPKPVVAAVNGVAAGAGFSLALACDFRVLGRSAALRQAYTANGLAVDGGGTFSLPRLVGLARALEIIAFDPVIGAEQALAWGLATRLADDGRVAADAFGLALELASRSLSAFARTKALLNDAFDAGLEVQLEREREALVACAGQPDGEEGLRAFAEKRRPVFFEPEPEQPAGP